MCSSDLSAAILLLLFLAWFVPAVVAPVLRVRSALADPGNYGKGQLRLSVEDFGGPEQALRPLAIYFRLPDRFAPRKHEAARLLLECGPRAASALLPGVYSQDTSLAMSVAPHVLSEAGERDRRQILRLALRAAREDRAYSGRAAYLIDQLGIPDPGAVALLVDLLDAPSDESAIGHMYNAPAFSHTECLEESEPLGEADADTAADTSEQYVDYDDFLGLLSGRVDTLPVRVPYVPPPFSTDPGMVLLRLGARDQLEALLKSADGRTSALAALALLRSDPAHADARRYALQAASSPDVRVRRAAARAIELFADATSSYAPDAWQRAAGDEDAGVRLSAVRASLESAPWSEEARAIIIALLSDRSAAVRMAACDVLLAVGAVGAIPELEKAAPESPTKVRRAMEQALAKLRAMRTQTALLARLLPNGAQESRSAGAVTLEASGAVRLGERSLSTDELRVELTAVAAKTGEGEGSQPLRVDLSVEVGTQWRSALLTLAACCRAGIPEVSLTIDESGAGTAMLLRCSLPEDRRLSPSYGGGRVFHVSTRLDDGVVIHQVREVSGLEADVPAFLQAMKSYASREQVTSLMLRAHPSQPVPAHAVLKFAAAASAAGFAVSFHGYCDNAEAPDR